MDCDLYHRVDSFVSELGVSLESWLHFSFSKNVLLSWGCELPSLLCLLYSVATT